MADRVLPSLGEVRAERQREKDIRADERRKVIAELRGPHARDTIFAALCAEYRGAPCWTQVEATQAALASLLAPEGEGTSDSSTSSEVPKSEAAVKAARLTLHRDELIRRLAGELHAISRPGARMPNGRVVGVGEVRAWADSWRIPLMAIGDLRGYYLPTEERSA